MGATEGSRPAPFAPVVIDPNAAPEEIETFEVFRIGDRSFRAPVRTSARMSVQAILQAERIGVSGTAEWMVRQALGPEALQALVDCPAVTDDQIKEIFRNLGDLYLGRLETETLGNSSGD